MGFAVRSANPLCNRQDESPQAQRGRCLGSPRQGVLPVTESGVPGNKSVGHPTRLERLPLLRRNIRPRDVRPGRTQRRPVFVCRALRRRRSASSGAPPPEVYGCSACSRWASHTCHRAGSTFRHKRGQCARSVSICWSWVATRTAAGVSDSAAVRLSTRDTDRWFVGSSQMSSTGREAKLHGEMESALLPL